MIEIEKLIEELELFKRNNFGKESICKRLLEIKEALSSNFP
jgi:hypothetical protein